MYKRNTKLVESENGEGRETIQVPAKIIVSKKKWVRYDEGAELYSMGINTFRDFAKEAKAIYHVKRVALVNTDKLDEFIELMCADDPE
ncbi:MAG: hypothetical protein K6B44_09235 [Lachnospiraceae bacterium]|nr:hypothetical protein [Lachnospiraceae bacterium]